MSLPWNVVFALESTGSRLDKEAILKNVPQDSDFWEGAKLALDALITFGVKKLPEIPNHGSGARWRDFVTLTDRLRKRELTGNAARDAIAVFGATATEAQWDYWFRRILEKDLNCGVGVKTVFKRGMPFPEKHRTKPFSVQLAKPSKDVKVLPRKAFLESKYDGIRTVWMIKKGGGVQVDDSPFQDDEAVLDYDVTVLSRDGRQLFNFGPIESQLGLLTRLPDFPPGGIVIDGEVMSTDFNSLQSTFRKKVAGDFKQFLMAFDVLFLEDFVSMSEKTAPLERRREVLEFLVESLIKMVTKAGLVPLVELSFALKGVNAEEDQSTVLGFFDQQVAGGLEGIIIKDQLAPYIFDRSLHWVKMKPTETYDLEVIGIKPGDGKYTGMIGALICIGEDSGRTLNVDVGSGLTDIDRKRPHSDFVGKVIEVEADSISRNKDGGHSLRFPRFKRFRLDKTE